MFYNFLHYFQVAILSFGHIQLLTRYSCSNCRQMNLPGTIRLIRVATADSSEQQHNSTTIATLKQVHTQKHSEYIQMPPGGVRFTHTQKQTTHVYYSGQRGGRKRMTTTPLKTRGREIFAHVQANNNIMTQGVTKPSKMEQKSSYKMGNVCEELRKTKKKKET